jgi:hypothetical protein
LAIEAFPREVLLHNPTASSGTSRCHIGDRARGEIDSTVNKTNLSSAVLRFVVDYFRARKPRQRQR